MAGDAEYQAALDRLLLITVYLHADMVASLETMGLTEARTRAVWELHQRGPMTQRALADVLGISARGVTGLIDGLEVTGFVTRQPHPTDRRAILVTFTRKGTETAAALAAQQVEFATRLFADLPDLAGFTAGLDQVVARLGELGVIGS